METFGVRLKRLRQHRGLTQQALATQADVPYMTIYRAEASKDNRQPRLDVAARLARALGVSLDVLADTYADVQEGGDIQTMPLADLKALVHRLEAQYATTAGTPQAGGGQRHA